MRAVDGFRMARPEDSRAIARLIRDSKQTAMPWLAMPHTLAEDEVWVAEILLPGSEVIVAIDPLDDDNILAVMALTPGWIGQLYVSSAQQRRGLGSRLLGHAQSTTVGSLHLWTFQRNLAARAFYERHGFEEVRRTTGENEEREPDVLYAWSPGRKGVLLTEDNPARRPAGR